eukprot:49781-Pyramimonas_sp.AAC.1
MTSTFFRKKTPLWAARTLWTPPPQRRCRSWCGNWIPLCVDVKGYGVDVKGYVVDVKGCVVDVKGYG